MFSRYGVLALMNYRFRRFTQLSWGAMDALIIVLYAVASIRRGRIPFWDDLQSIVALSREHGELALFIGLTGVAVHLSVVASGLLFIKGVRAAAYVGLAQAPFRMILLPSIPIAFLWPNVLVTPAPWLLFLLGVGAEAVKVWSLVLLVRSQRFAQATESQPV